MEKEVHGAKNDVHGMHALDRRDGLDGPGGAAGARGGSGVRRNPWRQSTRGTFGIVSMVPAEIEGSRHTGTRDMDAYERVLTDAMSGDEYGMVTNALLHGKDIQDHWHDVKVTHAGELTTSATIAGVDNGVAMPVTDNGGSLTVDASSLPLPTGPDPARGR